MTKNTINSLFWKESLRTSNFIRKHNIDLNSIFNKNDKLRFLMPIRNPLDCAISNLKGKAKLFSNLETISLGNVLSAILDEFAWFFTLKEKYPDRFFYFFEYEFNAQTLEGLLSFLQIGYDTQWQKDSLQAYQITKNYNHNEQLIECYKKNVDDKFKHIPVIAEKFFQFIARM